MDNKLTDNEIIRALEICADKECCEGCPGKKVVCELEPYALDLINRQKAEIERLQKYNTDVAFKHYRDGAKELAERLKKNAETIITPQYSQYRLIDVWEINYILKEMESKTE